LVTHPAASKPSYACGDSATGLLGQTIADNLADSARRVPGRDALVDCASGRRWTYAQFDAAVDQLARALMASGIERGDRIAVWAPNCAEWVLLQYGSARVGAILVCVNPSYRAHELAYVLGQSGTSLLFCVTQNRGADYRAMAQSVATGLPGLRQTVFMGYGRVPPSCRSTIRSTSSTPPAPPARPRAPRSHTTTSSTTDTWWGVVWATPSTIASACRCRSITASAW
jgi:acyl-CoA synthetase (AMP-forming)/AMP-acid ligase II